jgi:hypothetical protein
MEEIKMTIREFQKEYEGTHVTVEDTTTARGVKVVLAETVKVGDFVNLDGMTMSEITADAETEDKLMTFKNATKKDVAVLIAEFLGVKAKWVINVNAYIAGDYKIQTDSFEGPANDELIDWLKENGVELLTDEPAQEETKPLNLSEVILKLENCFGLLNSIYFEGKLPMPVITVQSKPSTYGHCSVKKVWRSNDDDPTARYELNIGAEYLNRPSENTAATVLHEMVHLYCRENDIVETCQNGRYHNKTFKQLAEERNLIIGYNRTIGYSETTPSPEFIEKLTKAGFKIEVPFARHTLEVKKTVAKRNKAHAYVCPICGQTIKTTGEHNLICGDCNEPMERKQNES